MILAIDARNETAYFGFRDGAEWVARFSLGVTRERTDWEWSLACRESASMCGLSGVSVTKAALSCVAPGIQSRLVSACARAFGVTPVIAGPGTKTGLRLVAESPSDVGSDIVCGALAAAESAKVRGREDVPVIVAEFGSALVFSAVAPKGAGGGPELLGVAIAPGMDAAMAGLRARTARLPEVRLDTPRSALARTTADALKSGFVLGWSCLAKGMIERFRRELGGRAWAIASGPEDQLALAGGWDAFDELRDDLVLEGVARIAALS